MSKKFLSLTLWALLVSLMIFSALFAKSFLSTGCEPIHLWMSANPVFGRAIFMFLGGALLLAMMPRTPFVILGGVVFGTGEGILWITLVSMLICVTGFLFSRKYLKNGLHQIFKKRKGFSRFEEWAGSRDFGFVLFVRMGIRANFGFANYALGAMKVRLVPFLWGSFLGILPGTLVWAYVGDTVGCSLLASPDHIPPELTKQIFISGILLTLTGIIPLFFSKRRKLSAKQLP